MFSTIKTEKLNWDNCPAKLRPSPSTEVSQPPWGPAPPSTGTFFPVIQPGIHPRAAEAQAASAWPCPSRPLPSASPPRRSAGDGHGCELRRQRYAGTGMDRDGRYPRRAAGQGLRCQMGPCWRPPRSDLSILGPPPPPLPRSPPSLRAPPTAAAAGDAARMVQPAPVSPMEGSRKEAGVPPRFRGRPAGEGNRPARRPRGLPGVVVFLAGVTWGAGAFRGSGARSVPVNP